MAEWCGLFSAAIRTAAEEATRLASAVDRLRAQWRKAVNRPRADSAADKLIEALPGHPILDVGTAERIAHVSNQAARLATIQLDEAGVIKRINAGRRNRAWEAVGLFDIRRGCGKAAARKMT